MAAMVHESQSGRQRDKPQSPRLIAFDMDSTLIQTEVIDELARRHGVLTQVADMTCRAMQGEMDFTASLKARVALLRGLDAACLPALAAELPLSDGAETLVTTCRALGIETAVISGGFHFAADVLRARLGLDHAYANRLEVHNGRLTGELLSPIVDPAGKAMLLRRLASLAGITMAQTVAVGDGANDLAMLQAAGFGVAFHAKATLRAAADATINSGGLDQLIELLALTKP